MPPWVPPHLRPGYVAPPPKVKPRGVHYVSNVSGHEEDNVKMRRYTLTVRERTPTRAEKAAAVLQSLVKRKVTAKGTRKSALKKGPKQKKRNTQSQSPKKRAKTTRKVKSRG
jgi:hypothetical protein